MATPEEKFNSRSKSQAWFCTTGLPSDVIVDVGDVTFHLHKFPLMSRSRKLQQLIAEQEEIELSRRDNDREESEIDDAEKLRISFPDLPGGAKAFEMAAKFCYGVKIELTASNAVPLRCAAEFLEMTEEISRDNLVAMSERFVAQSICEDIRDSIRALKSCDDELMPLAEALGIVQRCVNSIAEKAVSADPSSLFGWPIRELTVDRKTSDRNSRSGIDAKLQLRRKGGITIGHGSSDFVAKTAMSSSWIEELATLSLPIYKGVISAMKARDLSPEIVEGSLIAYAKHWIPGLSRSGRKNSKIPVPSESEQIELLETVIVNLPPGKSLDQTSTKILFGMLRIANILEFPNLLRDGLEKKIGSQLEQAGIEDLLMPSFSYMAETLYDIDCVNRLLNHFLERMQNHATAEEEANTTVGRSAQNVGPLAMVGKLVDRYLSEIASDVNLKTDTFCTLAFALPEQARFYDDGLYRAVDIYLKAHPQLVESEREKVCSVMDYQKLTLEACTHAAQNERLPLRAVVQVLFLEQLQLREAIAGSLVAGDGATHRPGSARIAGNKAMTSKNGGAYRPAAPDNQILRLDMDSMRSRVNELEKECSTIRKAIEKIDKSTVTSTKRGSASKKFGCKFRTQVCDSHERTIVEARKYKTQEEQRT